MNGTLSCGLALMMGSTICLSLSSSLSLSPSLWFSGLEICCLGTLSMWSQCSLLVRTPDMWLKGCEFESWQEQWENFLLKSQLCVLTLIRCPFHPCVTVVACKRPRSFCRECRWQVTCLNTHTPVTQLSRSGLTMRLSRHNGNLSGNELTCKFGYCGLILAWRVKLVCGKLVSTEKKNTKNAQAGSA